MYIFLCIDVRNVIAYFLKLTELLTELLDGENTSVLSCLWVEKNHKFIINLQQMIKIGLLKRYYGMIHSNINTMCNEKTTQRKLTCDGLDVFGCRWRRGKRCWYSVSWRPKGLQGGPCLGRDFRSNRSLGPLRSGILHGGQLGRCGDERYRLTFLHGRRNMRVNKAKKKKKKKNTLRYFHS